MKRPNIIPPSHDVVTHIELAAIHGGRDEIGKPSTEPATPPEPMLTPIGEPVPTRLLGWPELCGTSYISDDEPSVAAIVD